MILVRGAEPRDLGALARLARHLDSYNLPADRRKLSELIALSGRSFSGRASPESRRYLFCAEDASTGRVVGSSMIIARHGTPSMPHLSFRIRYEQKKSRMLGRSVGHYTLQLCADRRGFTEIGGLVVLPRWRRSPRRVGRLVSFARFAYIARHRAAFRPQLLVEYLPAIGPGGNALWKALGEKFTRMPYREADALSARGKEFILSLFPKERIYCSLLPEDAVRGLGKPGEGAGASLSLLEPLGFRFLSQVDPFDGGPHYGAAAGRIPVVRGTRFARARAGAILEKNAALALIAAERGGRLRACPAPAAVRDGRVTLAPPVFRLLRLDAGEEISVTPLDIP